MIFRQLVDADLSTYTYLLADAHSRQAIILHLPMPGKIREAVAPDLRGGKTYG